MINYFSLKELIRPFFIKSRVGYRRIKFALRFWGEKININPRSWISKYSKIKNTSNGSIRIGKNCEIHDFAMILSYGGHITMGDNCSLNPFSIIYGYGGVEIGSGVRIASHTVILSSTHIFEDLNVSIHKQGVRSNTTIIQDDVWIGAHCVILGGITIGSHSIIAAGTIVNKNVDPYSIVGGVPQKLIKMRK